MSDEPIDLETRRKARKSGKRERVVFRDANLWECGMCGSCHMRCWDDGLIECANCATVILDLTVVEG